MGPTITRAHGKTSERFADYTSFIDYASGRPARYSWKDETPDAWFRDGGYTSSLELARNGWAEGRGKMQAFADRLSAQTRALRPEPCYAIVGEGGIDIGAALAGVPECMIDWRDSETINDSAAGPVLKIVVDVAVSSEIDAERIVTRGAAILALIDVLEDAGRRVELEAIFYCRTKREICIPLKAADRALQADQIAYALAHPAFMRRFCHLAFGSPAYPEHQTGIDADLYFGPMSTRERSYETWRSAESTLQWLREKIADYGISVEDEKGGR